MKFHILLLSLLITSGPALLAQVDTGRSTGGTPYDQFLGPYRQVHARSTSNSPTIDEVRAQIRTGRRFRYFFDPAQPYVPQAPEVTEARQDARRITAEAEEAAQAVSDAERQLEKARELP